MVHSHHHQNHDDEEHTETVRNTFLVLQSNQVKRFAQESRFDFVVQNLNPFFVRTSQIEIEKWTSRVKPRFE